MIRHPSPLRRWAHLGLFVAALLQFAGAALGPWAHTSGRELSTVVAICAPDEHGPHTPGTHDESACGVWQALTSPAALPAGFSIPAAWTAPARAAAYRGTLTPASPSGSPRARAPPLHPVTPRSGDSHLG